MTDESHAQRNDHTLAELAAESEKLREEYKALEERSAALTKKILQFKADLMPTQNDQTAARRS